MRIQDGRTLAAVPIGAPADDAIPVKEIPVQLEQHPSPHIEVSILQRERDPGVPAWLFTRRRSGRCCSQPGASFRSDVGRRPDQRGRHCSNATGGIGIGARSPEGGMRATAAVSSTCVIRGISWSDSGRTGRVRWCVETGRRCRPTIDITIAHGQVTLSNATLQATVRQPMTLHVTSDATDESHVTRRPITS